MKCPRCQKDVTELVGGVCEGCHDEVMYEYEQLHRCCPMCGSDNYSTTMMGFVYVPGTPLINKNHAKCMKCGWKGIVHDLTRGKEISI